MVFALPIGPVRYAVKVFQHNPQPGHVQHRQTALLALVLVAIVKIVLGKQLLQRNQPQPSNVVHLVQ